MGIAVLVYGKSGSGKSRSLKNFASDEILYVNVERKPLPFRNKFKYTLDSCKTETIFEQLMKMPTANIKTAVIDDAGYIMTEYFMANHRNKKQGASFEMYDEIADKMFNLVSIVKNNLPDDTIVYIVMHEDTTEYGDTSLRTIGRMLDRKVCLEGMVTIAIRCTVSKGEHVFRVTTDGKDITKTPEDMFDKDEIENDLKKVDEIIRDYYGFKKENKK